MKRYGDLWPGVVSWPNLVRAADKARRAKRRREVVLAFDFRLERELLRLRDELTTGTYRPGPFTSHWITIPKRRLIAAAPYRDRVVQHALMNILEPILDRHFHPDSYACRRDKGTHAAARRLQQLMRRYPYTPQCDIVQYFPCIDRDILKERMRRLLKDRPTLALVDHIIDSSDDPGLPIGNLTSQWLANWYLDPIDHWVTNVAGCGYVRYCDDFILLSHRKSHLRATLDSLRQRLSELRLSLHDDRLGVAEACTGRTFVGFGVTPLRRRLVNRNVRSFLKRLGRMRRAHASSRLATPAVERRLAGWLGHAAQADSRRLVGKLAAGWLVRKGRWVGFRRVPRSVHSRRAR